MARIARSHAPHPINNAFLPLSITPRAVSGTCGAVRPLRRRGAAFVHRAFQIGQAAFGTVRGTTQHGMAGTTGGGGEEVVVVVVVGRRDGRVYRIWASLVQSKMPTCHTWVDTSAYGPVQHSSIS